MGYTTSCQKRTSPPGLCLIHNSFCFAKYLQTRYPNPIEFSKNTEDLYAIGWPLQGDPRSTVWSSDQWLSLLFALDLIRHVSVTIWWRQEDPINILSWTCGTERKCGKEILEKVCYILSLELTIWFLFVTSVSISLGGRRWKPFRRAKYFALLIMQNFPGMHISLIPTLFFFLPIAIVFACHSESFNFSLWPFDGTNGEFQSNLPRRILFLASCLFSSIFIHGPKKRNVRDPRWEATESRNLNK